MKDHQQWVQWLTEQKISFDEHELLSHHTSFRIGGAVDLFVKPSSVHQIQILIPYLQRCQIPWMILGKGSNLLFSDQPLSGVIVQMDENFSGVEMLDDTHIFCEAGASLQQVCLFAQQHFLRGMEALYGIPGSVGGAIYMNAGAYGTEICQVLESADFVDIHGQLKRYPLPQLDFSYRHSRFQQDAGVVVGGIFALKHGDSKVILEQMKDYMGRRLDKQPLEYPSAGSTFKRPSNGYASAIIDTAGLKGYRCGGAMVSEKHAGFVINYDHATYQDVMDVIQGVQQKVEEQTGIALECEVRIVDEIPRI